MNTKFKIFLYGFLTEAFAVALLFLAVKLGAWGPCGPSQSWTFSLFLPAAILHLPALGLNYILDQFHGQNVIVNEIICFLFQWAIFSSCWFLYLENHKAA